MKYLLIFIFLFLAEIPLRAQDLSSCGDRFTKSFMKSFDLSAVDSLRSKPGYFFSILVETDKAGLIISMEENTALDTVLKPIVAKTLKNIDLTSLKWCDYRKEVIIFPVFVFNDKPSNTDGLIYDPIQLTALWNFKKKSHKEKRVFDPLVIYFSGEKKQPVY